ARESIISVAEKMKLLLVLGFLSAASAQFFSGFRRPFFFNRGRPTPSPSTLSSSSSNTGEAVVDETRGDSEYHYSWLHDGFREYPHSRAVSYCKGLGSEWAPVSIETTEENNYVTGVVGSHRLNWIWTGGQRAGAGWRWPSGNAFSGLGWSHTGGFRRPQPDNREGNENCLAILNDFYRDGIKWHDVACHHTKPTICERKVPAV
ncbi:Lectin C-type domain, partial [Halocaridina rubra]